MNNRSTLVTVCIVVTIVVSLPAGAYSGVSEPEPAAQAQAEDDWVVGSLGCLDGYELQGIDLNLSRQEATNFRADSLTIEPDGDGTTDDPDKFRIQAGSIDPEELCIDGISLTSAEVYITQKNVSLEDTTLSGPWTTMHVPEGYAEEMTIAVSPTELLNLLTQLPDALDLMEVLMDIFGLSSDDADVDEETAEMMEEIEENGTDAEDETADESNETVEDGDGNETATDDGNETTNESEDDGLSLDLLSDGGEDETESSDDAGTETTTESDGDGTETTEDGGGESADGADDGSEPTGGADSDETTDSEDTETTSTNDGDETMATTPEGIDDVDDLEEIDPDELEDDDASEEEEDSNFLEDTIDTTTGVIETIFG